MALRDGSFTTEWGPEDFESAVVALNDFGGKEYFIGTFVAANRALAMLEELGIHFGNRSDDVFFPFYQLPNDVGIHGFEGHGVIGTQEAAHV